MSGQPEWKQVQQHVDHVAHEFRAPLALVHDCVTLLSDGYLGPITDEQSEYLQRIQNRVNRMIGLMEDWLDTSRMQDDRLPCRRSTCGLNSIMESALELLQSQAASKEHTIHWSPPAELPSVDCDSLQIERVMVNLVGNAIKYTPPQGRIEVVVDVLEAARKVVVRVRDNGPGMTESQCKAALRRFHRLESRHAPLEKGFGLGLHIASQLVRLHGSCLEVSSHPGAGTEFRFELPVSDESSVEPQRIRSQQTTLEREAKRVLAPPRLPTAGAESTTNADLIDPAHRASSAYRKTHLSQSQSVLSQSQSVSGGENREL